MASTNIQCKLTGPDGDLTVTIPIEEYNDLIESRASLDLILSVSDDRGYGGSSIIEAIKKQRADCVLYVKRVDEPEEKPGEAVQAEPKRITYAGMDLEVRPGDKVRYIGKDDGGCGACKPCSITNGTVGIVEHVTFGREYPIQVRWPGCSLVTDATEIAFVSREETNA